MAEIKIDGRHFKVDPPLAKDAVKLQLQVGAMLKDSAPLIAQAMTSMDNYDAEKSTAEEKTKLATLMAGAVTQTIGSCSPDEGAEFIERLVGMAQIKAENGSYENCDLNTDFTARPEGLYELVAFVLKVALGPFISGLLATMKRPEIRKA